MSDESCNCGCSSTPAETTKTTEQCNCGCGERSQEQPKKEQPVG